MRAPTKPKPRASDEVMRVLRIAEVLDEEIRVRRIAAVEVALVSTADLRLASPINGDAILEVADRIAARTEG